MAYTDIDKPTDYFNTVLYTGNGSTQSITGVGFQPDWVWLKSRDTSGYNHGLSDIVRGVTKRLVTNSTGAESTQSGGTTSFDSDGFSLGTAIYANDLGDNYVAWNWLASNTTASNTQGDITSTVSANTTSGFSIVSYTGNGTAGATVGHGIDTPKMIIVKNRSNTSNWTVGHDSLGWTKWIKLNSTDASLTNTVLWNDTAPTSSVFSLGTGSNVNTNTDNYIAYCFAEKKGFSKFGSYTGNGSADGPFIYTGFKPAMVIIKLSSGADNWTIYDSKRDGFNGDTHALFPNTSDVQTTDVDIDLVSNGFKIVRASGRVNTSGGTHIYMAFASNPFVTSTGIPTTAR
jgi:hypothetical protein